MKSLPWNYWLRDTLKLQDVAYLKGVTGDNSCCCECLKRSCNCYLIREKCERRSTWHRKTLTKPLWDQLLTCSTDNERIKLIEKFEKETGYTFHHIIPWEALQLDVYELLAIDVLHVELYLHRVDVEKQF